MPCHLNWAVPLRVAPAAMCNRVAINVPKRILADLPSLVRRLRERLPDVDVQGADVADRPFAAERRQADIGKSDAEAVPEAEAAILAKPLTAEEVAEEVQPFNHRLRVLWHPGRVNKGASATVYPPTTRCFLIFCLFVLFSLLLLPVVVE